MMVASVRTGAAVAPLLYENSSATPAWKFVPYRSTVAALDAGTGLGVIELIVGVSTAGAVSVSVTPFDRVPSEFFTLTV
jgi:hypothetical protein